MVHAEKKSLTVSKLDRIPIEDMIRPPLIPIVRHTRPNPTFQPSLPSIQSYNHHSTYNRPTQPSHQQDLDRLPLSCSYPSNGPLGIYCFHHGASLVPGCTCASLSPCTHSTNSVCPPSFATTQPSSRTSTHECQLYIATTSTRKRPSGRLTSKNRRTPAVNDNHCRTQPTTFPAYLRAFLSFPPRIAQGQYRRPLDRLGHVN